MSETIDFLMFTAAKFFGCCNDQNALIVFLILCHDESEFFSI